MTNENTSIDPRCICRCCGWSFGNDLPWGVDGMSPEYDICDCCGCEAGDEDDCPENLIEYRKKWLDCGAKWYHLKTKPIAWEDGRTLKKQLERVVPKKRFHKVPDFSPFEGNGYNTPDAAIAAGQRIDTLRKQELGLDLSTIKGKAVRRIHWSMTELTLEFDTDLYLILKSRPDKIDAFIAKENIVTPNEWYEDYELVFNDKTIWRWSPTDVARYYTGRVFTNIFLEFRVVWLYFQKCPKLIEVFQFSAQELELPILHWETGT